MLRAMRRPLLQASSLACLAGLLGLLGAAGCGAGSMPPSLQHPLAGARAPSMGELGGDSGEVGIWHGAPVKVTVVDFWASWCQGCKESLPALDALYRDKRGDGLNVVGVSVDERREDAYAMAQALHASFPVVVDSDSRLLSQYRVAQVPLSFVVDRGGTVRWVGRDTEALKRAVEVVLAE
jgi:cytochrome c biogenesis protein CcmG/thiol:disulfide interchange protein DsbE